jgi:hypothetical protein
MTGFVLAWLAVIGLGYSVAGDSLAQRVSVVSALVLAGGIAWGFYLRPILLRGNQIANCTNLRIYGEALEEYRKVNGQYPARLVEAMQGRTSQLRFPVGQDAWGHALAYRTDGTSFIVMSLGRDGKPDGLDFWSLRLRPVQDSLAELRRCESFDADAMVTDREGSRPCCK